MKQGTDYSQVPVYIAHVDSAGTLVSYPTPQEETDGTAGNAGQRPKPVTPPNPNPEDNTGDGGD